jgi:hypothetical protein
MKTPVGDLSVEWFEEPMNGGFQDSPLKDESELAVLEYYIDALLDADLSPITNYVREMVNMLHGRAVLDVQWPVQPYELLCFPNTMNTVLLVNDYEARCRKIMDSIVKLDDRLFAAVAEGGADFIFLGGPGVEMISPRYYNEFIIPYSKIVTDMAHARGLLVYSHICSPIEPFLTMGFYNRMGIDLFETLSPPPVGNVASLADAMTKLDPAICTRGNIGLDLLVNATPEVIRDKTLQIMEQTEGRKHIVAASDYLFYQVKEENVHAMVNAVQEYHSRRSPACG